MPAPIPPTSFAFIIGAMKCGTTSLFSYLEGHPEICASSIKEPEFFSEHQDHAAEIENYYDLWQFDPACHKFALEASTGYTKFPSEPRVAQSIYDFGLRPKLIYIVRNPFDRIASHFNFMQRDESWMENVDDAHLINTSNYFLQLEQYRPLFGIENLLVLDFDELIADPAAVLTKVYRFLGISETYFPEEFGVKNKTVTESKIEKEIKASKLGSVLGHVPKPIKQLGKKILRSSSPAEKRTLSDAEREFIFEKLKNDMAQLKAVYGIDVDRWGF